MIDRRTVLGFLGSAATATVLAKLPAVSAEPIPVSVEPKLASGGFVKGAGDVYMNCIGKGELWFRATADDAWQKIGAISDLEICPRTIQAGTFSDPNYRDELAREYNITWTEEDVAAHPLPRRYFDRCPDV